MLKFKIFHCQFDQYCALNDLSSIDPCLDKSPLAPLMYMLIYGLKFSKGGSKKEV